NASISHTVTTYAELVSALSGAPAGHVIYIPEGANINLTGKPYLAIPAGVTIASNRGSNGSQGGRIFKLRVTSDECGMALYANGDNVRITGIRLEGPDKEAMGYYCPMTGIRNSDISPEGRLIVDNNEIWGWSFAAVRIYQPNATQMAKGMADAELGSSIANIHHNFIHHCQDTGYGYGVVVAWGPALIKGNIFDYTKHAVACGGYAGEGYEASYNIHLGHNIYQVFDVHGSDYGGNRIAGTLYRIHHNSIQNANRYGVNVRGVPINQVIITNNELTSCTSDMCRTWVPNGTHPIWQSYRGITGFTNISVKKNLIDGVYSASGPEYFEYPGWD
ncbi:MAG: hypothetical protein NTX92_08110, partial [Euryarchaeota archaeon]|nr:hypothetical protein [Euryarchaeota archaeon]